MDRANKIFELITDAWNTYFWEYKFCQDRINFTEEIKTNYYGDILSYLNETMVFLSAIEYVEDFQKSIFQAIGILQIIYAQQDLTDELLYIFKLQESLKPDKEPNRTIRNELVGHPVRRLRKGEALISSAYFGRGFKNGKIHYILYARTNGFKGDDHIYDLSKIIADHFAFVQKYATIIARKIRSILEQLKKKLLLIHRLVNKGIEFKKLMELVRQFYNPIFKESELFTPEILLKCFERKDEHFRYQNVINLFTNTLNEYLPEVIGNIDELFKEKMPSEDYIVPEIRIVYSEGDESSIVIRPTDRSDHLSYEFSKLTSNHPIFGIEYFKSRFNDDGEIIAELVNMENNTGDILEFYASYEYLRKLLLGKGYLKE